MNLDEYRALKAQQNNPTGADVSATQAEQPAIETLEEAVSQASQVQLPPTDTGVETPPVQTGGQVEETPQPELPTTVKLGDAEYNLAELLESKRQAEEIAREQERLKEELEKAEIAQKYFNKMMENPGYAKTFAENNGLEFVDPKDLEIKRLEKQYNKVLLDREIENMQIKYKDFDPKVVMPFAVDNQIKSLEDAYLLHKSKNEPKVADTLNVDAIKEQIRQELLNELKLNVNTDSLIGTSGTGAIATQHATPQLTPAEARIARGLKLSPEEYLKYKTK